MQNLQEKNRVRASFLKGLFFVIVIPRTEQLPPGQLPPKTIAPRTITPGQLPSVQLPPGQFSPRKIAPGQFPPRIIDHLDISQLGLFLLG